MAATRSQRKPTVLSFAGPPDEVEGYVPVDPARRREIRVRTADDDTELRSLTAPAGDRTLVRLVLPATFPSGEIDAVVTAGEEEFPAVIRTSAVAALDAVPSDLDVTVDGREGSATIHVTNVGNVAVDLPDIAGFGLMKVGGLDGAIGTGLRTKRSGLDRFGEVADALAAAHGGLVRVALKADSSHLPPGGSTDVQVSFRPSSAEPGTRYHGVLPILDLRIGVRLRVEPGSAPPATPRKRPTTGEPTTEQEAQQ